MSLDFRFGHLDFCGMKLLHIKNMLKGFTLIKKPERMCEGCIFGKQHRKSFSIGKSIRACAPLEIMHSDICGPIQTSSICDFNCFLTFINDFIRKTWISFVKHKYDAFGCFRQFKAVLEKQIGYYIKSLRIEKGSEYISKYLFNFRKPHGRHKKFTTCYTP